MATTAMPTTPRHDYFQTDTQVIVSFYVKGCRQEDVQINIDQNGLSLNVAEPSPVVNVQLAPLFAEVDAGNAGHRVLSTKIEISLQKVRPGQHWPKLVAGSVVDTTPVKASEQSPNEAVQQTATSVDTVPVLAASSTSSLSGAASAPRARSKWDTFKDDDDEATEEGKEAEDGKDIDAFFKKLYADADDDTRRAMMKSYQESGGTALSTNWEDVKKQRVETRPPDGMEARKWNA